MSSKKTAKKATINGLTIAVIAAITLLVVVVVGLFVVSQSPERQIAKGFGNLVKVETIGIESTVETTGATEKVITTFSGVTNKKIAEGEVRINRTDTSNDTKLDIGAQLLVAEDGTVYAKIDQPKKLVESFVAVMVRALPVDESEGRPSSEQYQELEKQIGSSFIAVGEKIDNKWIKLTSNDTRSFGGSGQDFDCYVAFAQKLSDDAAARKQLAGAYSDSRFMQVKEKLERDGNAQGYRVSVDSAKLKEFTDEVAGNESVKQLGDCGTDLLTLGIANNLGDQTADVWVDRFSHNITRIKYTQPGNAGALSNIDIKLSYDKSVQVSAPNDAITMDEVIKQTFPGGE